MNSHGGGGGGGGGGGLFSDGGVSYREVGGAYADGRVDPPTSGAWHYDGVSVEHEYERKIKVSWLLELTIMFISKFCLVYLALWQ